MEKLLNKVKERNILYREFYCDGCGEMLGESEEYDDGYYREIGAYEQEMFVDGDWYKLRCHYCPDCAKKKNEDIVKMLVSFGFEKGW